jgi:putative oxidoreductase
MLAKVVGLLIAQPARALTYLQDLFALGLRLYVGWPFFNAGLLKLGSWNSTLQQFQYDFRVPLLPPVPAAVLGTFGELVFPVLLWIGLTGRLAALGLQIVNVVAVMSIVYLYADGLGLADPAFGDHYLWGVVMLALMIYGPGRLSLDYLLARRSGFSTAP